jgi:hypothetical protein
MAAVDSVVVAAVVAGAVEHAAAWAVVVWGEHAPAVWGAEEAACRVRRLARRRDLRACPRWAEEADDLAVDMVAADMAAAERAHRSVLVPVLEVADGQAPAVDSREPAAVVGPVRADYPAQAAAGRRRATSETS